MRVTFLTNEDEPRLKAEIMTSENIEDTLGYTPLNGEDGKEGQFAVSNGQGGISWRTITNAEEVDY